MAQADGSIVISAEIDDKEAQKQLNSLTKKIDKLKVDMSTNKEKQSGIEKQLQAAKDEALKTEQVIKRLESELQQAQAITSGQVSSTPTQYIETLEKQKQITTELEKQREILAGQDKETERIDREYTKITDKVIQQTEQLEKAEAEAGGYAEQLMGASEAAATMSPALDEASKRMDKFTSRIKKLASRVFIFTMITSALRSIRSWLWDCIKTNDEAVSAVANLKGALLTLAQPLVNVIIPAFTAFVNVLTKVVSTIASLLSKLFGTTVESSAAAAESLYNESNALEDTADAAEEATSSLAGFDEINQISTEDSSSSSSSSSSSDTIAPDFTGVVSDALSDIVSLFAGVALLALGAILTFTGVSIGLGIALMVVGAAFIVSAVSANWNSLASLFQGAIAAVLEIVVGGALLIVGMIFAFTGVNLPLGIALMVVGAATLVAAVALNWNYVKELLTGSTAAIVEIIVGGILVVVGMVLAFAGVSLPLGIGLMAAGAVALGTAVALNWDTVKGYLTGSTATIVELIVGGVLVVVGMVLAFTGAALPLGIGLMAAGAVALGTAVALNWNTIKDYLTGSTAAVVELIVGGVMVVLGMVLAFTGAALPLGIALIAAGAVALITAVALNWNYMVTALQGPIAKVVALASTAALALGIILCFTGVGIPLGIALIAAGAAGLVTVTALNWNAILDKLKGVWSSISTWWSNHCAKFFTADYWKTLGKNMINGLISMVESGINKILSGVSSLVNGISGILNKIPGVNIGTVSWGNVTLPRLAQGAVIPPNREFLAVLGDQSSGNNIEAPESLIRQIVREEVGGTNTETLSVLQSILQALQDGQVIKVNETILGRTTAKAINKASAAAGSTLLVV